MTDSELAPLIADAARRGFDHAHHSLKRDEILGYAIMSHDTADSCGVVVATTGGLNEFRHYGTDDEFLYSAENWNYFISDSYFETVNEELLKLYEAGDYEVDPDWHDKFRKLVFNSCVLGLEVLIHDGYFGPLPQREGILVVLCISDSFEMQKSAPAWFKRLNPPSVFNRYTEWHMRTYGKRRP